MPSRQRTGFEHFTLKVPKRNRESGKRSRTLRKSLTHRLADRQPRRNRSKATNKPAHAITANFRTRCHILSTERLQVRWTSSGINDAPDANGGLSPMTVQVETRRLVFGLISRWSFRVNALRCGRTGTYKETYTFPTFSYN